MKKIAFLTCAIFVLFYAANAQQGKKMSAEDKADKMVDKLERVLLLTDQQEEQLESIFENSFQKMKMISNANKDNSTALKEALQNNQKETDMAVQKVLTQEQFQKYQEWQQQHWNKDKKCCSTKDGKHKKHHMNKDNGK